MNEEASKTMISVIIPIYNVEQYLRKCIESVINQTYKNLQIILVDDGSTDNSGIICDEYAKADKRIVVIHKKNEGLGEARNTGLRIAKGEYIGFIDSDDIINNKMYDFLYKAIISTDSQMASCPFSRNYQEVIDKNFIYDNSKVEIINRDTAINDIGKIWVSAWNKLYKKELFNKLQYPFGVLNEDEYVIHELVYKCKRIAVVYIPLYYYRITENSIMTTTNYSATSKKMNDSLRAFDLRISFIFEHNWQKVLKTSLIRYCDCIIEYYYKIRKFHNKKDIIFLKNNIKKEIKRCPDLIIDRKYKIFSKSISLFLVYVFLKPLFERIKSVFHFGLRVLRYILVKLGLWGTKLQRLRKKVKIFIRLGLFPKLKKTDTDAIISLTTYGERFYQIQYTLFSLFKQSVLPEKIILWLSETEFSEESINKNKVLKKFIKHGLEIRFCKDTGSYKKIIPAIDMFPDSTIIICDDDAYYDKKWLELLLNEEKKYPDEILCHRVNEITIINNIPTPYTEWKSAEDCKASYLYLPTGVGGTLLKKRFFISDITNAELFLKLAPNGDDLWIWANAVLNNTRIRLIQNHISEPIDLGEDINWEKLYLGNAYNHGNDNKLNAIITHYPELKIKFTGK